MAPSVNIYAPTTSITLQKAERPWVRLVALLFSFALATIIALGGVAGSTAVSAEESDPEKESAQLLNDQADEFTEGKKGDEGFLSAIDISQGNIDRNSFAHVINRVFGVYYLNDVRDAVQQKDAWKPENGLVCDVNAPGAGTILYHNCDVPNLTTGFFQSVLGNLGATGLQSATNDYAKLSFQSFGLPSNIPNDNVPVADEMKSVKYSALELFGYNLRYTQYKGEWDNIAVYNKARMLSNYGLSDNLKLGAKSIINGATGGSEAAIGAVNKNLKEGDILGAIGDGFTAFVEGGVSASINTIVDTSDLNVFNQNAWYRVGFSDTVYGARELSNDELTEVQKTLLKNALAKGMGEEVKLPNDLLNLQKAPDKPKEGATLEEWKGKEGVKDWFEIAHKYGLKCDVDPSKQDEAETELSTFYACIPGEYARVAKEESGKIEGNLVKDFLAEVISGYFMSNILKDNADNFNAPWNRYVCLNPDGSDKLTDAGLFVPVVSKTGNLSGGCAMVRPPIQNGYFGNGYVDSQAQPGLDTRWAQTDHNMVTYLLPMDSVANMFANGFLFFSGLVTRVSNTFLNMSFAPMTESTGLREIVIRLIEDFRESVFFPMSVMVAGFGALYVLFTAVRQRAYREALVSIGFMLLAFVSGAVLMFKPESYIKIVDDTPAAMETAVVGGIFGSFNENADNLCTVSGTPASKPITDSQGNVLPDNASASARMLLCENWRVNYFNPWIYGQWGTTYDQLYANGSGHSNTVQNTNSGLVGDASVNMGSGVIEKNWALYQVDQFTAGTATEKALSEKVGVVRPDLYRVVDMQAGPNNGEGRDGRFFDQWSGNGRQAWDRLIISGFSTAGATASAVTVIAYSVNKIIITFVSVGMGIVLPFVFLIGMFPKARSIIRKFLGTVFGLMVQRVLLILMLAIMMKLMIGFQTASTGYIMATVGAVATAIAFLMIRGRILGMAMKALTGKEGDTSALGIARNIGRVMPKSVKNAGNIVRAEASGRVSGTMASLAMGQGIEKAIQDGKEAGALNRNRLNNVQRRRGFGLAQSTMQAIDRETRHARQDVLSKAQRAAIDDRSADHQSAYEQAMQDKLVGKTNDDGAFKNANKAYDRLNQPIGTDSAGNTTRVKDKMGEQLQFAPPQSSREARAQARFAKAADKLANESSSRAGRKAAKSMDLDAISQAQKEQASHEGHARTQYLRPWRNGQTNAEVRYDKAMKNLADVHSQTDRQQIARNQFKDSLSEMKSAYADLAKGEAGRTGRAVVRVSDKYLAPHARVARDKMMETLHVDEIRAEAQNLASQGRQALGTASQELQDAVNRVDKTISDGVNNAQEEIVRGANFARVVSIATKDLIAHRISEAYNEGMKNLEDKWEQRSQEERRQREGDE